MMVKNIYIRLTTNALVALVNFATFIIILKTFGKGVIGSIAYCYSLAGIFSLFSDMGLSTAYNKFLASKEEHRDINTFLVLKFILIVVYIIIFLLVYFFKLKNTGIDNKLLLILFTCFVFDLISQIFTSTFTGRRDFAFLSKLEIGSCVLLFVYSFIVCFVIRSKYFIAANKIVLPAVMILGGMFYFFHNKLLKFYKPRWADIKKYFNYALPIAFSSISGRFIIYIDKILLGRFIGMRELGLYEIASRCYTALDRLVKPVTSTLFTEIVHRVANTPSFFREKFRDIIHMLSFFGSTLALIVIFVSSPVVNCFFGAENLRASFVLKFFALVILAKLFWRPYEHVIYAIEKHKVLLYLSPLNLVIRMACYYFLIPLTISDVPVGAIALPITEFIVWFFPAGIVRCWILKKEYGSLHMLEIALKVWLPLALLIIIGYFFHYSIFVFAISLIAFVIAEYYFRVLTKERLNYLVSPFRGMY